MRHPQGTTPAAPASRLIRIAEVAHRTGLCRRSIYAEISADRFPRSIPLTARAVGWDERAIQEWIESRLAAVAA